MSRRPSHLATLALATSLACAGLAAHPHIARATTYAELHEQVVAATDAYQQAQREMELVQADIDENEQRIAQIESALPACQERAAGSVRTLYKMQQASSGIIDLVLSANSFDELVDTIYYLERIQGGYLADLEELNDLQAQLQEAKDTLNARKARAEQDAQTALAAYAQAQEARDAMYAEYLAQAQAEYAEAQEALARAAEQAQEQETFVTASGNEAQIEVVPQETEAEASSQDAGSAEQPQQAQQSPTSELSDRDQFVQQWGSRIDSYLSGSPLEGYGSTFAAAAYDNGVDPRVSPAIATVESSQGSICFRSHNAWGWGNASYDSWESAINSQVAGYASNYGSGVTYEGAQTYCPPTADAWYSSVTSEMGKI